jgi:hypothetical protein
MTYWNIVAILNRCQLVTIPTIRNFVMDSTQ